MAGGEESGHVAEPGVPIAEAVEAWAQPAGVRSRTARWRNPSDGAARARELDGLSLMRGMLAGDIPPPPITTVLGYAPTVVEEGEVVFETIVGEHQYNPIGTVHGGVITTLLDSALGCAVHTTLPQGTGYTTIDIQVRFVRPVTVASGRLRCEGTVVNRGRRLALAEGRLLDEEGRLLATATSNCLIFEIAPTP